MSDNSPADVGGEPEAGGWTGGKTAPPSSGPTRCPSCRKPIRFVKMATGNDMPVEAKSVLVVVERRTTPQADLFGTSEAPKIVGHLVQGWIPHWQNCTDTKRWRKR